MCSFGGGHPLHGISRSEHPHPETKLKKEPLFRKETWFSHPFVRLSRRRPCADGLVDLSSRCTNLPKQVSDPTPKFLGHVGL